MHERERLQLLPASIGLMRTGSGLMQYCMGHLYCHIAVKTIPFSRHMGRLPQMDVGQNSSLTLPSRDTVCTVLCTVSAPSNRCTLLASRASAATQQIALAELGLCGVLQIFEVLDNCIDEVQGGHATNVEVSQPSYMKFRIKHGLVQAWTKSAGCESIQHVCKLRLRCSVRLKQG